MSDLNDPRVFFAAERTLLAWNRTSLTLMAFGFVIERFGLFLKMIERGTPADRGMSFWVGVAFILLGAATSGFSTRQYRTVLKTLKPIEIPEGYRTLLGVYVNLAIAFLGVSLAIYLFWTT